MSYFWFYIQIQEKTSFDEPKISIYLLYFEMIYALAIVPLNDYPFSDFFSI